MASPSSSSSYSEYRQALMELYERYDPEKVSRVDGLLHRFVGHEEALVKAVERKFSSGVAPPSGAPAPPRHAAGPAGVASPSLPTSRRASDTLASDAASASATMAPPASATDAVTAETAAADDYRSRLVRLYEVHAPLRVGRVDHELAKYRGREEALLQAAAARYGLAPATPLPSSPATSPSSPRAAAAEKCVDGVSGARDTSAAATAASPPPSPASYRARAVELYRKYDPAKLHKVDAQLAKYAGREAAYLRALERRLQEVRPAETAAAAAEDESAEEASLAATFTPADASLRVAVVAHARDAAQHFESCRLRLLRIYHAYAPDRAHRAERQLERYPGREEEVIAAAVAKYGPEPPHPAEDAEDAGVEVVREVGSSAAAAEPRSTSAPVAADVARSLVAAPPSPPSPQRSPRHGGGVVGASVSASSPPHRGGGHGRSAAASPRALTPPVGVRGNSPAAPSGHASHPLRTASASATPRSASRPSKASTPAPLGDVSHSLVLSGADVDEALRRAVGRVAHFDMVFYDFFRVLGCADRRGRDRVTLRVANTLLGSLFTDVSAAKVRWDRADVPGASEEDTGVDADEMRERVLAESARQLRDRGDQSERCVAHHAQSLVRHMAGFVQSCRASMLQLQRQPRPLSAGFWVHRCVLPRAVPHWKRCWAAVSAAGDALSVCYASSLRTELRLPFERVARCYREMSATGAPAAYARNGIAFQLTTGAPPLLVVVCPELSDTAARLLAAHRSWGTAPREACKQSSASHFASSAAPAPDADGADGGDGEAPVRVWAFVRASHTYEPQSWWVAGPSMHMMGDRTRQLYTRAIADVEGVVAEAELPVPPSTRCAYGLVVCLRDGAAPLMGYTVDAQERTRLLDRIHQSQVLLQVSAAAVGIRG
ncbi:hypothetical protein NESM_000291500 [Novymonas esmeraldas]|uniref:Uncharacterized protein n=1 Tax=Novymonas esmeraldas TaxID=1808958 RepID=A0AAW0FFC9_9TRYP